MTCGGGGDGGGGGGGRGRGGEAIARHRVTPCNRANVFERMVQMLPASTHHSFTASTHHIKAARSHSKHSRPHTHTHTHTHTCARTHVQAHHACTSLTRGGTCRNPLQWSSAPLTALDCLGSTTPCSPSVMARTPFLEQSRLLACLLRRRPWPPQSVGVSNCTPLPCLPCVVVNETSPPGISRKVVRGARQHTQKEAEQ